MTNIPDLERIKRDRPARRASSRRMVVGMATCGIAAGARDITAELEASLASHGLADVSVEQTGCMGLCFLEPMMEVHIPGEEPSIYIHLTPEKARKIVEGHMLRGVPVDEYLLHGCPLEGQVRVALRNCGIIDPEDIHDYIAHDGYATLQRVLTGMSPAEVTGEIKASGLRGRGGGGFPTGVKWELCAAVESSEKYVICNADEGDPGAFMDRSILEGDPHCVLEAMAIAAFAIGASTGYIYVRAEYPLAVERLTLAISRAEELGLLGDDILGSGFSFRIGIKQGSGAFVCGEETALIASIEGKRGMPKPRPPFPAHQGLWGKPTLINNVETFANVPTILRMGGAWFAAMGTERSKGTKVFALGGDINRTGLVEVVMGTTLRHIVHDMGGGIPGGRPFKAAQTGGPSGGCIPLEHLDTPIDYESLAAIGSMMGSGGMIIMGESACMVDIARFFLEFTTEESCGKCPPCRVGTRRMLQILQKIIAGQGEEEDITKLEDLAQGMKLGALCGLGQSAPNPVVSTLKYFRHEYLAHVRDKKCPAGVCPNLIVYVIDPDVCVGCTLCATVCPMGAITGQPGEPHTIDPNRCGRCGTCMSQCPSGAISKK